MCGHTPRDDSRLCALLRGVCVLRGHPRRGRRVVATVMLCGYHPGSLAFDVPPEILEMVLGMCVHG